MADNLSPLVNLDLINKIYKTINAQIAERVYDPQHNPGVALGGESSRYSNAFLQALNVSGDVTITGNITGVKNILATTFNNLTLKANTTGFEVSGGTTFKKLTVADTTSIDKPLTISANTTISASLTVSAATKIIKELTVGADNTGTVAIKSAGAGNTTIVGPSGATAQFNVATTVGGSSANTGSVIIQSSGNNPTAIIGPDNGTVTFTAPTDSVQSCVELKNVNNNTSILKISSGKTVSAFSNLTVGNSSNTGSVAITPKGANALNISSNTTTGNTDTILKSGTCVVEGDLPNVTVGSATTATINSWTDNEIHYLATVKASGENQGISAETDSTKKLYIERKTVDNATTYHFYAGAVHNAVWNDLADCIEVPENTDLEFGYCYSWNGDKVEKTSRKSKNCIGIHSNTAGLFMGEKPTKTIQTAVAGFALAYVDKIYPEGTPLTWSDNGKLTKCTVLKRVLHPERVIATFYKEEKQESWHGVKVNNRHWVKIR